MRDWLTAAALGLALASCSGLHTDTGSGAQTVTTPTGKLRVAFLSAPIYATKDPATGELKGVAITLGRELARRANTPFEPVVYASFPELMSGAGAGQWDVALMGIDAQRATVVDFSAPFMNVEQGYLVRAGVPIAAASDIDAPGVRVGVLDKSSMDALLSKTFKNAVLVRARSIPDNYALLDGGKTDVMAATKPALFAGADSRPGTRVIDGRLPVDAVGMAVPKGREALAAYVGRFVEQAKADGSVRDAIAHAGLRGVVVAPPK
ncbi:MAG: transporter substrate-binding domain-containing protein [Burkholderiales bacterium]